MDTATGCWLIERKVDEKMKRVKGDKYMEMEGD